MTNGRFIELFDKSRNGLLSESEAIEWNEWIGLSYHNLLMVERLQDDEYLKRTVCLLAKARQEDWQCIIEKHPKLKSYRADVIDLNRRIRIAAVLTVILIGVAACWFIRGKWNNQKSLQMNEGEIQSIAPADTIKASVMLQTSR